MCHALCTARSPLQQTFQHVIELLPFAKNIYLSLVQIMSLIGLLSKLPLFYHARRRSLAHAQESQGKYLVLEEQE